MLIVVTSFSTAFPPTMAASSSSSSFSPIMASSSSATDKNYDVFLSFRGEDTRYSFTDHLYKKLVDAEIRTFRDNEDIDIGKELNPKISRAIKESKGSILVLSPNYATSTWCLDELWLILQQRRDCGHFVIPIFYHVDPSDVRKQNKAFNIQVKVSSRWTEENVNKWKAALREVADLKGSEISGPETEFLKVIVDVTNQNLDHKDIQCPPNLIGMTARYEEISSWLNQSNSQFLTICGMGGSGKTTLAKYIYDSNRKLFENRTSFLEDIARRCEEHNGLFKVQEELFNDILGGTERNKHTQRMSKFVKALKEKKTFIVLDDIGDIDLRGLLGYGEINAQSKIIIVTNRKNADYWFQLTDERGCRHHEVKLLDDVESLRLLSLRAFRNETPKKGFEELAVEAVRYCEGNPLALNLLGSSLSEGNTIHQWRSQLSLLEKDIDDKIDCVLRRSYMSLTKESFRKLFLDIACFFVGEDKDYVEKILEPDYAAVSGIATLTNKYLLSVSPNKKLMMHRLVQDMGRKIVRQESCDEPAQRSRVWDNHDSHKILRRDEGSKTIRGLALDMRMLATNQKRAFKSSDLKTNALNMMDNLKLLQLNFVKLTGSYENFSEDLRWLCWHGYHQITIPSDLFMGNMVALDMSNSKLKVFEPPMGLEALQFLNLKDSNNLSEIRYISRIPNLETFILWNCCSLVHVCETIGDLKSLALLNMTGCENLCNREQINLLVGLNASTSGEQVTKQPPFSLPTSLEKLFLNSCNLECTELFPLSFGVQRLLEYLNLGNNLFEFLPCYDHLENLRVLDLSFCKRLKWLQCLPSTLVELYVYYCESLEMITFQSHQFTLQEFGYGGCTNLSEVEDFFKLVPIAELDETDLGHLKWLKKYQSHEVLLVGDDELTKGRSLNAQMLYEFDIRSTSLLDIEDSNMTPDYISESSSVSFDVPLCPKSRRLKGLNVIIKYTLSGEDWTWFAKISTPNGDDLIYNPKVFGKPGSGEVATWLSYWPIGNRLHVEDNINVSIVTKIGLKVHECGASLVYDDDEEVTETKGWVERFGGDLSGFQLSTGAYYLCRRDFFELIEVGRPTPDWFRVLVGDVVDYTEIQGWRKTGRPKGLNPSSTEVNTVRCIIRGPEQEEFYKIAEMSKLSLVDKTLEFTSSILGETMKSRTTSKISAAATKRGKMTESMEVDLNDELIRAAHYQSMEAHKDNQQDYQKHGVSSSSMEVLIFAFKGSWEVEDWYDDDHFGETYVDDHLFPSIQRIGEGRLAKVNKAFLQRFQDLLKNSRFQTEVEKAVKEGKKILLTGHSSGGAIASFATLWILEEYARKRAVKVPICCVTFGSPLIGDGTLSHAVLRQNWATLFTHFVMEHDIVPRLMLAPKKSVQEHLPDILRCFQQKVDAKDHKSRKFPKLFHKSTPGKPVHHDRSVEANQAVAFFENVMVKASVAARNLAFNLMEPTTNSLTEKLSNDYVKVSPYSPFGTYVFCIRDEAQLIVESPDAILQLLFYFLQLTDEHQDLADFALNTLDESLSYEEVNKGLQRVNLKEFKGYDVTAPLFELGEQARWCLMAAEEADRRKKEKEKQIDASRRNNGLGRPRTGGMSIEDMLDAIRGYKERHAEGRTDYYDAFKQQDTRRDDDFQDFDANINRLKLAKIWDAVVEMLRRNDLPDEFEGREEWVRLGTEFRRLVEPLDIANYYRHLKGSGYMGVRPKRYKFTQRWYEHANVTGFESVSESSFMGVVEELKKEMEEHPKGTPEGVKEGFDRIEEQVEKWKSDEKIPNEDVYWGEPTLSMLRTILSPNQ